MEFKIQIFEAWKLMLGLGNQPNGCHIFDTCTYFRPLYTLSLSTVRLFGMGQCCHQIQSNYNC